MPPVGRTASPGQTSLTQMVVIGVWCGIVTGLVEGAGLLLFQRINWASWGPMIHVSEEILWISPLVDVLFFVFLALIVFLVARLTPRLPAVRVLAFLLVFLAIYDWLMLTGRLYQRACLLLALGVAVTFSRWFGKRVGAVLRFWRKTAPWVAVTFLLVLIWIQGGKWLRERNAAANLPAAAANAPNVLVIVVDTLRADHLSSYGYGRPTSPETDEIAKQGVLFENAIAPSSWSLPSHISLLTGLYQYEHGIGNVQPQPWLVGDKNGLGGHLTLGEALEQRGYRTGAFSANRTYFTTSLGFKRGFIHFEDYFQSPADMLVRTLYGRRFSRMYLNRTEKSKVTRALRYLKMDSLLDKDSEGSSENGGGQAVRKRADVVNAEVLAWIDCDRRHPFFVFLNYFDAHFPYGVPAGHPRPAWDKGSVIDEYDASVNYVDGQIGLLLQSLRERGLANNTLVVITSDHGESLGQHGLKYHAQALYRELVQVPLVVWFPGHVPAGVRVATPVTNTAIPGTIMELVGTSGPQMFPQSSLGPLWQVGGSTRAWPNPLSEIDQNDIMDKGDKAVAKLVPTADTGNMSALVTPQWHLIMHEKMSGQFYDWVRDPGEANNLAETPEGAQTVIRLKLQLEDTLKGRPPARSHQ